MTTIKQRLLFIVAFVSVLTLYSSVCASARAVPVAQTGIEKQYITVLLSLTLLIPEIAELDFSDNGTVSLVSDLWDATAVGTYNRRLFTLNAQLETQKFFDTDFDEEIQMSYDFTALPVGLRGFFMLGVGIRHITFFSDNKVTTEYFFIEGPGL